MIATYEAGWSGFWLARWLIAKGVEVHVIQPSSVPVDRRMRRAKSDGTDAELLLRTLMAWLRGEPRVCDVEIGAGNETATRLIGGLEAGERVILYPDERIADGTRVAVRADS